MSETLEAVQIAREATEAEVAHYHDNGWVKMEGLISKEDRGPDARAREDRDPREGA
ncbi:hypothetical protein [Phenylobacterium sp. J367]|uniref:hypothetical protein n=1 Tax=Phenylobacterium sp. J367 TaxID=2898435 RepID=UPI002151795D|nr:hypothetical protein [Phenylobacterium sp. J367]MCR5879567.1 hypothetical protein [Phenylobacterium sp. J367]